LRNLLGVSQAGKPVGSVIIRLTLLMVVAMLAKLLAHIMRIWQKCRYKLPPAVLAEVFCLAIVLLAVFLYTPAMTLRAGYPYGYLHFS
jgi:hypothetical protein